MDDIVETYKDVDILETMTFEADSFGRMTTPAHLFKANVNGERISASRKNRENGLIAIKNKIDQYHD